MSVRCHLAATGALLLCAACLQDADLNVGFGQAVASAVLVSVGDSGASAWAVQSDTLRQSLPLSDGLQVFVLEYEVELKELGLVEGPLMLSDEGVPLPPSTRSYRYQAQGGGLTEPELVEPWPDVLRGLRIRPPSVSECVDNGGCFGVRSGDEALVCKTPCDEPEMPQLPEAPAPVELGPCPAGWLRTEAAGPDDIMECEPWPAVRDCAPGTAQRPGSSTCTLVGAACPMGTWPESLPAGEATFYVDAAAAAGGDGSALAPFATLSAVPLTTTGTTVIALAAGSYSVPAALPEAVHIVGACVGRTDIDNVLTMAEGQVVLQDLRAEALRLNGGALRLQGVEVATVRSPSITVDGGRLRAHDLSVRPVGDQTGLRVRGVSEAVISSSYFSRAGVRVGGDGTVELHDSVIDRGPFAVVVDDGGQATLRRSIARNTQGDTLSAIGQDAVLTVDQVISEGGPNTRARVYVAEGGVLQGRALTIRNSASAGMSVRDGGTVRLQDLLIRDTLPQAGTGKFGTAIEVVDDPEAPGTTDVTLTRAHLVRSRSFGILAKGPVAHLDLTDARIIETEGQFASGELGTGLVAEGAQVQVQRLLVTRSHGIGINMEDSAELTGSDLWVQDTLPRDSNGAYGRGIEVNGGSYMEMERLLVDRAKNIAIQVLNPGARASIRDLTITNTERSECFGFSCNAGVADGLTVTLSAQADVERFFVHNNGQYAVRVINPGTRLTLKNGTISGSPVGLQVITETYDLELLTEGVRFLDNEENLSLLAEQ